MKKIVIPGELVCEERKQLGDHVFLKEGKIYSDVIGIAEDNPKIASVVPLKGFYRPRTNDLIVGIIESEKFAGYIVDINSFYPAFVSKDKTREPLRAGSIISAKVSRVNELNEADLDNLRVFYGGEIISVSPVKVPRMIGKEASMLNLLKDGTGCNLMVGRNGRVWVKGGDIDLLTKAIAKIEKEAHLEHLTNKVEEFLKQNKPKAEAKEKAEEKMDEKVN